MNDEISVGIRPFWFWNGNMKEEEIARQIMEMKQKGIPGFMIHPRQGMEIPYLSREYFDRVRLAVKLAKKHDMEVWIYDEYPYPSGICAGEVLEDHPEYLSKRLRKKVQLIEGPARVRIDGEWGKVLLARAYPLKDGRIDLEDYIELKGEVGTAYLQDIFQYSGLTPYNDKRYFTGDQVKRLEWQAPKGSYKVYLITECVTKRFKYFENYIDTMNPRAIRRFIELTHERYKKEIGEEFGKTIKGFFTDEAAPFPQEQPWSPLLAGKVNELYGIDLISGLPALWEGAGEMTARLRYAYWNTATDCFIEAYDQQLHQWCGENGLLYIGEKPIMRSKQLQHFDIPGIDNGHQKVGSVANMLPGKYRANGKMVSSAAHFYDKKAALCEVGHSIGWGETMQDLKWMFDWLAVVGIDFWVIHGFFYTADGLKKYDAPPSSFFQMPWWEDAGILTKYVKDLGNFLKNTKRRVKILMMDPITSIWTSDAKEKRRLEEDFGLLQTKMMYAGLDYYIIDPDLFACGQVICENGRVSYCVHNEIYEIIVLPPVRNLEKGAAEKLLEFMKQGGQVCALSIIPFERIESDGYHNAAFGEFFKTDGLVRFQDYRGEVPLQAVTEGNSYLAGTVEEAVNWLSLHCPQEWSVLDQDGLGREQLPVMIGTDEDGGIRMFVVNSSSVYRKYESYW